MMFINRNYNFALLILFSDCIFTFGLCLLESAARSKGYYESEWCNLHFDYQPHLYEHLFGGQCKFLHYFGHDNAYFVFVFKSQTFCSEQPIFLREHNNGMYRVDTYFLSKMAAEVR